jgi:hypothetical protein
MTTVTVKKQQAGIQQGVADKFSAAAKTLTDPPTAGLRAGTLSALKDNLARMRGELKDAETLARQGKNAVTDIQDGDDQSGQEIANC